MEKRWIQMLIFVLCASNAFASPVGSQVCRDLANGVQKQYEMEDVNACYECEWYILSRVETSSPNTVMEYPDGTWCLDGNEGGYLEIDLGRLMKIGGFQLKGYPDTKSYLTEFKVTYKDYTDMYRYVLNAEEDEMIFTGPANADVEEEIKFTIPLEASAIRIYPIASHNSACLSVDVYSCSYEVDELDVKNGLPQDMPLAMEGYWWNNYYCSESIEKCVKKCMNFVKDIFGCEICECAKEYGDTFESDISLSHPETLAAVKKFYGTEEEEVVVEGTYKAAGRYVQKWTGYKSGDYYQVPYTISGGFSSSARSTISQAISAIAKDTCIKLVPRGSQRQYINFVRGSGCSSPVGKQAGGNSVSLGYGCEYIGTIIHEILHSLGFWHEQSRPDRDSYVRINYQNIQRGMGYNFQKQSASAINSMGSPYDIGSVMHYSSTAFSANRQTTITDLNGRSIRTQRNGLSKEDIIQINKMYGCSKGTGGGGGTGTASTTKAPTTTPTSGNCGDDSKHCSYWARIGECKKNPGYMLVSCKRSCRVCSGGGGGTSCKNKSSNCDKYWKSYCRSSMYLSYMKKNCAATCNYC